MAEGSRAFGRRTIDTPSPNTDPLALRVTRRRFLGTLGTAGITLGAATGSVNAESKAPTPAGDVDFYEELTEKTRDDTPLNLDLWVPESDEPVLTVPRWPSPLR